MNRFAAFLPALVLFQGSPSPLGAQSRPAVIKIDTDRAIGEVDPHLFGNFTETSISLSEPVDHGV